MHTNLNTFSHDQLIHPRFFSRGQLSLVNDSEAIVLGKLLRCKEATQADLGDGLTFSQQSISRMLTTLQARGMVIKGAAGKNNRRGQPSFKFYLNPQFAYSIGISLMAKGVSLALINFAGEAIDYSAPSIDNMARDNVFSIVTKGISTLLSNNQLDLDCIFGIGLSVTGFYTDSQSAMFNTPDSLNDFALTDLNALFSKALNFPVWSDNDGNAAAIAESIGGIGKTLESFAYFYFATGLGGGVINKRGLFKGINGNAGEFRAILPTEGYLSPTLESLRLSVNKHGSHFKTVNELVDNYSDSLAGIEEWISDVTPSLSLMVSATSAVLDTEAIVFGGIIPKQLADRLIAELNFFDINRRGVKRKTAKVITSELSCDSATYGAALLPFTQRFFHF
jgi:predicted NBD/HSP70 family sugar kinase